MEAFQKLHPKAFYSRLMEQALRPDGRSPQQARAARVVPRAVGSCDGSALATVGRTSVVCGVTLEVGPPVAARPRGGRCDIKVELGGVCSASKYSAASATNMTTSSNIPEQAYCLERALRRFTEAGYLDLDDDSLVILERRIVWVIKCHLVCLDDDGNVTDACYLALDAALRDVVIPEVVLTDDETVKIVPNARRLGGRRLSLRFAPKPLTFGVFDMGSILVFDPSSEEEEVLEGFVTVVVDAVSGECVAIETRGGGLSLNSSKPDRIRTCLDLCRKRSVG